MDNHEIKQVLIAARGFITEPEHWTKGSYVKDKNMNPVFSDNPDAYCYCAIGAIEEARLRNYCNVMSCHIIIVLNNFLPKKFKTSSYKIIDSKITNFNDHPDTTHKDVLSVFDQTIASL